MYMDERSVKGYLLGVTPPLAEHHGPHALALGGSTGGCSNNSLGTSRLLLMTELRSHVADVGGLGPCADVVRPAPVPLGPGVCGAVA